MRTAVHDHTNDWIATAPPAALSLGHDVLHSAERAGTTADAGPDRSAQIHPLARLRGNPDSIAPDAITTPNITPANISPANISPASAVIDEPLRSAVALSPTGFWFLRADHITDHANPSLLALLGRSGDQMAGSHLLQHVAPECRPFLRTAMAAIERSAVGQGCEQTSSASIELTLLRRDERRVIVLFCVSRLDSGGYLATVTDLSEMNRREQTLRVEKDRLASSNSQLTHGLNRLTACMRKPTEMLEHAAGLLDGHHPAGPSDSLICRDTSRNMARQLDDIELWTAQLGNPQPLPMQLTDLAGIVRDVMAWAAPAARKRGLRLVNGLASVEQPLEAMADAATVTQILRRLVDNAIRFTPSGGTLRLSAETGPGPNGFITASRGWIMIRVTDNGLGIPDHRLARLRRFDRPLPSPDLQGVTQTGFGLLIADRLASRNGGAILLDSEAGRGTTASLSLPAGQRTFAVSQRS